MKSGDGEKGWKVRGNFSGCLGWPAQGNDRLVLTDGEPGLSDPAVLRDLRQHLALRFGLAPDAHAISQAPANDRLHLTRWR